MNKDRKMRNLLLLLGLFVFSVNSFAEYHCRDVAVPVPAGTHTAGDLVVDTFAVSNLPLGSWSVVVLDKLVLRDLDDQAVAMDIWFLDSNTSMGTVGDLWQPSDAIAGRLVDRVNVAAGDYVDLTNNQLAVKATLGKIINLAPDKNLYIGMVTEGAPTYTENNMSLLVCVFARVE